MEISLAKGESSEDPFGFRFQFPAAVLVENMERIVINRAVRLVLMLVIVPGFVLLDHFLRVHKLGRNSQRKFQHGFVPGGGGFLRKESYGSLLLDRDRSLIGR